jgi:hypothetical protein
MKDAGRSILLSVDGSAWLRVIVKKTKLWEIGSDCTEM